MMNGGPCGRACMNMWFTVFWAALLIGDTAADATMSSSTGSETDTSSTDLNLFQEWRTYNGTGNNLDFPLWGSVGQRQLRTQTSANYTDGVSAPPGDARPSARELLSELFLETTLTTSATSVLYVGWGILVGYDLVLNLDNTSEPFNAPCNDPELADVWCPFGSRYDISFNRSRAEVGEVDRARSPINYATAYVDLDWLYGRDEASAAEVRAFDGMGRFNLTDDGLPPLRADGTWQVVDQRPASFPVTFALQVVLLREHNRCCEEDAEAWNPESDEEYYQLCRQWMMALFQHITENDFAIKLLGGSVKTLGADAYGTDDDQDDHTSHSDTGTADDDHGHTDATTADDDASHSDTHTSDHTHRFLGLRDGDPLRDTFAWGAEGLRPPGTRRLSGVYDESVDAGVDVFFSTVMLPAFYAALPSTVGLLDEDFLPFGQHGIELAPASADVHDLVKNAGGIDPILRGAAFARTHGVNASFASEVSVSSPLFNFAVEVVQRGRDHGVPTYNDAREAYGLGRVSSFSEITPDGKVQALLSEAYGGDISQVDAYVGAIAEDKSGTNLFVGPLLQAVFLEQLYRAIIGDRLHHDHDLTNQNAYLLTVSDIIGGVTNATSMQTDAFTAPELGVVNDTSTNVVALDDGCVLEWNLTGTTSEDHASIKLSARNIGSVGMIGLGFGGTEMGNTDDFIICEVVSEFEASCRDRTGSGGRSEPPLDEPTTSFKVTDVAVDGDWTSVTFERPFVGNKSQQDYNLFDDLDQSARTNIIFAWRSGEGVQQHPNTQRGSASVNFLTGDSCDVCSESNDFYALHGALILLAWMVVAPYGLYQSRYRKGTTSIMGNLWWEMHQECMVVCAEAVLPLSITAIVTTGGPHQSSHARWGFYMIAAIALQLFTGWMRVRALEAKGSNFSLLHRVNKHLHIYAGWIAYVAGVLQCYRGLELVSGADELVFSAAEIDFEFSNFQVVREYLFPIWLGTVPLAFLVLEVRKQIRRFFVKGSANLLGILEVVNKEFSEKDPEEAFEDRLMPRTKELPIYTSQEFNEKVLNGQSWVIVDGAILDVSSFAKRHPGGARLIMNAIGTDVTSEILGEQASVGNAGMTFTPHDHTETALEIVRSLMVGYVEDDEGETDTDVSVASHETSHAPGSSCEESPGDISMYVYRRPQGQGRHRGDRSAVTGCRLASFSSDDEAGPSRARSCGYSSAECSSGGERGTMEITHRRMAEMEQRRNTISESLVRGSRASASSASDSETTAAGGRHAGTVSKPGQESWPGTSAPMPPPPAEGVEFATQAKVQFAGVADDVPPDEVMAITKREPRPFSAAYGGSVIHRRPMSLGRPKVLEDPLCMVDRGASNSAEAKSGAEGEDATTVAGKNSIGKVLKRLSAMNPRSSGDEAVPDQREGTRPFSGTKRVWERKNPLLFFHVCPLLLHERMAGGNGRPVYKFVFACPGRAAALVNSMTGVCHFNMRISHESRMGIVERSYNAFPVRIVPGDDGERCVVPASEASEGDVCIEMRIRIDPDGAMGSLLMQLVKNADNPAVRLQGPFLRDRLIPPPAHRNVIMIAAGTGVNPMMQMIRDYLFLDPAIRNDGPTGGRSRLVLLWQNKTENDIFCAREITQLQKEAGGLLEVATLISGDMKHRKLSSGRSRRAKARRTAANRRASKGEERTGHSRPEADREALAGPRDVMTGLSVGDDLGADPKPTPSSHRSQAKGTSSAAAAYTDSKLEGDSHDFPQLVPRPLSRVEEEDPNALASHTGSSSRGDSDLNRESVNVCLDTGDGDAGAAPWEHKRADVRPQVLAIPQPASRPTNAPGRAGDKRRGVMFSDGASRRTSISAASSVVSLAQRPGSLSRSRGGRHFGAHDFISTDSSGPRNDGGPGDSNKDDGPFSSASQGRATQEGLARAQSKSRRHQLGAFWPGRGDSSTSEDGGELETTRSRLREARPRAYLGAARQRNPSGLRRQPDASSPPRNKSQGKREGDKSKVIEDVHDASLDQYGVGLRRGGISKDLIKRAMGPSLVGAVAATRISLAGSWNVNTATKITEAARAALAELCGTSQRGGLLQIVVSGPAGFVFHVQTLLMDLHIPPESVVLLD